jgi:hypothetical protein
MVLLLCLEGTELFCFEMAVRHFFFFFFPCGNEEADLQALILVSFACLCVLQRPATSLFPDVRFTQKTGDADCASKSLSYTMTSFTRTLRLNVQIINGSAG